jgi:hypothetical protein
LESPTSHALRDNLTNGQARRMRDLDVLGRSVSPVASFNPQRCSDDD